MREALQNLKRASVLQDTAELPLLLSHPDKSAFQQYFILEKQHYKLLNLDAIKQCYICI
jgi:hypothetical protein